MTRLQVLICTYGSDGMQRVGQMQLPRHPQVSYLVSAQDCPTPMPHSLCGRDDVQVCRLEGRGLSRNRNNAFAHSDPAADILLIADDDLIYRPEYFDAVIEAFDSNAHIDYATFCHTGGDGKVFPAESFDFAGGEPSGYYLTSFELAVRRRVLAAGVRFPEDMGAGCDFYGSGEENVFLLRMQRKGLHGRFFPYVIAQHPGLTTGHRMATDTALRGQGRYLRERYGMAMGLLRLLRDVPRRPAPWPRALARMLQGFMGPLARHYFKFFRRQRASR